MARAQVSDNLTEGPLESGPARPAEHSAPAAGAGLSSHADVTQLQGGAPETDS